MLEKMSDYDDVPLPPLADHQPPDTGNFQYKFYVVYMSNVKIIFHCQYQITVILVMMTLLLMIKAVGIPL